MSPYRQAPLVELPCPRCKKPLPPLDVATCACGVWITAFAASEVLTAKDLAADPMTRWWRVRAPCPECGEQMTLFGEDPGNFMGCEVHGYFVDADTVPLTGLARGIDETALARKREDHARLEADREQREQIAMRRARDKHTKVEAEAALARELAARERRGQAAARPPALGTDDLDPELDGWDAAFEDADGSDDDDRSNRMALIMSIGARASTILLERIGKLEARVAELERRLDDQDRRKK